MCCGFFFKIENYKLCTTVDLVTVVTVYVRKRAAKKGKMCANW